MKRGFRFTLNITVISIINLENVILLCMGSLKGECYTSSKDPRGRRTVHSSCSKISYFSFISLSLFTPSASHVSLVVDILPKMYSNIYTEFV